VVAQALDLHAVLDEFARECFGAHREEKRILRLAIACLRLARRGGKVPLLLGGVGLGKTYCAMKAATRFIELTGANPVVYVQLAPPGGGVFNFGVACGQILREVGRSQQLIDLAERAPWDRSPRHVLIEATQRELRQRRPGVLILDEIERMFGNRANEKGHLETLAWWADTAQVPIFAIGNYEAARAPTLSTKISRRFLPLHYEPYERADGLRAYLPPFKTMITFLEARRALEPSLHVDDVARKLFRLTHGRVGETKNVLMLAGEIALGEGKPIGQDQLEAAIAIKLSAPVRAHFARDLVRGRAVLACATANEPSASLQPRTARSNQHPGRRLPSIDVVGNDAAAL
jgi:AAA domain